jgi:hypothetical protein
MATLVRLGVQAKASPALGAMSHGTILYERTVDRRRTLCDDGTRTVRRDYTIFERFEMPITASPRNAYAGQMHPCTKEVDVRGH